MKDNKKNKILLTGGRGFLGSKVLKKLKKLNYNVDEADIVSRDGVINLLDEFNLNNYDCILHLGSSSKTSNSPTDLYSKNIFIDSR